LKPVGVTRSTRGKSSPPARGRGLKLQRAEDAGYSPAVAPRAGAWIETRGVSKIFCRETRRPPRGGVD